MGISLAILWTDNTAFLDGPDSPNAILYFNLLGTMGLVLWRLVKRPPVLTSLDKLIAPLQKFPSLRTSHQRQISCAAGRPISSSAAADVIDHESSEGQEAVDEDCNDVLKRNPPREQRTVVRTILTGRRPHKHWLPSSEAIQADQRKTEGKEAAAVGGGGVLPYSPSSEQVTVLRRVFSASRLRVQSPLWDWDELQFQSNVGEGEIRGLLVDHVSNVGDFRLWVELLRFRGRVYGLQGTIDIWEGIKKRRLHLPVYGPEADVLWGSIIALGLERPEFLHEIYLHARKIFENTGTAWRGIYTTIVGRLLATDPNQAYEWHKVLLQIHRPGPSELGYIFIEASKAKVALGVFEQIYKELDVRTLYATIIPRLCNLQLYDIAHRWHYLLVRVGDVPGSYGTVKRLLRHLALYKSSDRLRDFTRSLVDAGVPFPVSEYQTVHDGPIISREIMSRLLGEAHSIAPKTFSDEFCARLFATKAFSVDTVMSGLRMLGLEAIGPLSLKEIASRDASTEAVAARMDKFQELGISVGSSIFARLVKQFAVEGREDMLNGLLSSDQHPDALEDSVLQESLLASFHAAHDWPKYHNTMAVLACHSKGRVIFHRENLILRSYIRQRNLAAAMRMLENMRLTRVPVSSVSTRLMRDQILRPRKVGRRPVSLAVDSDDLGHLIGLWQGILRCGGYVAPLSWREVLRRLGQTGRLRDLEKLALWLVLWYHPNNAKSVRVRSSPYSRTQRFGLVPRRLSAYSRGHPYRILFSTVQQEAMIAWGFKTLTKQPATAGPSLGTPGSWSWGLKLLLKLKDRGVAVSKKTVRRVLRHRLRILYGLERSAIRANRLASAQNPYPLRGMLAEIKVLWKRLFVEPTPSLEPRVRRRLLNRSKPQRGHG